MKKNLLITFVIISISLALTSCSSPKNEPIATTPIIATTAPTSSPTETIKPNFKIACQVTSNSKSKMG